MNPEELLKKGLNELGFSYSEEQINVFMTLLYELKRWNKTYNLTAIKRDEDIVIKHFFDSLLYLKAIQEESSQFPVPSSQLKICDVGTGAGFPGIPIKIIRPEINVTLIESSRKKTAFLRHIVRMLKLNRTDILNKRLEALGKEYEKTYDIIVSRATFRLKEFIKKACPYVKGTGILILSKGPKAQEEIKEIDNRDVAVEHFNLPFLGGISGERNLLVTKCEK